MLGGRPEPAYGQGKTVGRPLRETQLLPSGRSRMDVRAGPNYWLRTAWASLTPFTLGPPLHPQARCVPCILNCISSPSI